MRRADDQQDQLTAEGADEFVSLARQYFAGDFPNPERKGCPPRADLETAIQSGKLPDDTLRQHLFGCSQCFSLYRQLRDARREVQPHVPFWQRASEFIFAQRLILGSAFAVLVVAGVAVLYFTSKTSQNNVAVVDQTRDGSNANVSPTVTPSPAPAPTQNELTAVTVAQVDLRDYVLRRGNESSTTEPLHVKQGMIAFSIMLPEGSPAGAYSVSLLDAFGKTLRSRGASSPDGKKLSATLNLSFPENQKYRLCVSRADEPPNCYPIMITKG